MSLNPVEALKGQARAWAERVVELYNTPVPAHLEPEKQKLLSTAKTVKTAIERVFPSFKDIAHLDQHLDFLPVMIGGAVAVAAAAVAKWTFDHSRFKTRVAEFNRLAELYGPDKALKILGAYEPSKPSRFGLDLGIGSIVPVIALGAGVYLLMRQR